MIEKFSLVNSRMAKPGQIEVTPPAAGLLPGHVPVRQTSTGAAGVRDPSSRDFKPFQRISRDFKPKNHRPLLAHDAKTKSRAPHGTFPPHNTSWRGFINKKSHPLISYTHRPALPCPHVRKSELSSRPHPRKAAHARLPHSSLQLNRPISFQIAGMLLAPARLVTKPE